MGLCTDRRIQCSTQTPRYYHLSAGPSLVQRAANRLWAGCSRGGPFRCSGWVIMRGCLARRPLSQRGSCSHHRQQLRGSQGPRLRRGSQGANEPGPKHRTGAVGGDKVWKQRKGQLIRVIRATVKELKQQATKGLRTLFPSLLFKAWLQGAHGSSWPLPPRVLHLPLWHRVSTSTPNPECVFCLICGVLGVYLVTHIFLY